MRLSRKMTVIGVALLLVGAGVGVGVAALRPGGAKVATADEATAKSPPTIPPAPPRDPVVMPTLPPKPATPAPPSYDVAAVQRQLNTLHYYIGPADGKLGAAFRSAVMAFQKVQGLGADGAVGPSTLAALVNPRIPQLRGGPANRIEVDLSTQVLYLVEGGQLMRVLPISSGSGGTYKLKGGGTARSLTPVGWFTIERRIRGERKADLGVLYDPMYFYRGWAIHGSNSVPAYPASHGCVRVTRPDAIWLFNRVPNGTPVFLYGGTHTFTAGSAAPGTDNPAGDGTAAATPTPTPTPESSPSGTPTSEPTATPTPSEEPTPNPDPTPTGGTPTEPPLPTP